MLRREDDDDPREDSEVNLGSFHDLRAAMSSRRSGGGAPSRGEREREKVVQDRLQLLLTRMLKDEDNKYCVDCDAKGESGSNC